MRNTIGSAHERQPTDEVPRRRAEYVTHEKNMYHINDKDKKQRCLRDALSINLLLNNRSSPKTPNVNAFQHHPSHAPSLSRCLALPAFPSVCLYSSSPVKPSINAWSSINAWL
jgi:hypothetical protein